MQPDARRKLVSLLGTALGLGMVVLAIWIFEKTLSRYELSEIIRRLRDIPGNRLALAGLCAGLSYFIQTLYDFLALASLGRGASVPRTTLAAFVGNAMVNNMGFSLLTATSIRYRFYSAWGYSPLEIAQVVAMTKLAFFTGLLSLAGLTLLVAPLPLPGRVGEVLDPRLLGALLLIPPASMLFWNGKNRHGYIRLGKYELVRPAQRILVLQILVSAVHLVFSGLTLYFLIPAQALGGGGFANPLAFLGAFMAIKVAVLFFPIPGGLGVLEGTSVALLAPAIPAYTLLGGLLAYRILYYLVPFGIALAILMVYELGVRSGLARGIGIRILGSRSRGSSQRRNTQVSSIPPSSIF
ncbi:MAG TPA: lysylphosphatidylglycerol synthase domain-containing protein [Fibrobacteria bacterium]|nr:lysylphosphatidylglycerol synthase domain-containing protein [Fibrobacteria bacterium]